MRIGSLVRIRTGPHTNRLAVVENQWDGGSNRKTVEVFMPGSTKDGGSILTYQETDLEIAGAISIRHKQTVKGERLQWVSIQKGDAITTLAVVLKDASGANKIDTREVRRRALWSSNYR